MKGTQPNDFLFRPVAKSGWLNSPRELQLTAQVSHPSDVAASSEHKGYREQTKVFAKTKPVRVPSKIYTRAVQAKSNLSDDSQAV